jgi:hypothetical protein
MTITRSKFFKIYEQKNLDCIKIISFLLLFDNEKEEFRLHQDYQFLTTLRLDGNIDIFTFIFTDISVFLVVKGEQIVLRVFPTISTLEEALSKICDQKNPVRGVREL